jgi:hypothetical protein
MGIDSMTLREKKISFFFFFFFFERSQLWIGQWLGGGGRERAVREGLPKNTSGFLI